MSDMSRSWVVDKVGMGSGSRDDTEHGSGWRGGRAGAAGSGANSHNESTHDILRDIRTAAQSGIEQLTTMASCMKEVDKSLCAICWHMTSIRHDLKKLDSTMQALVEKEPTDSKPVPVQIVGEMPPMSAPQLPSAPSSTPPKRERSRSPVRGVFV